LVDDCGGLIEKNVTFEEFDYDEHIDAEGKEETQTTGVFFTRVEMKIDWTLEYVKGLETSARHFGKKGI